MSSQSGIRGNRLQQNLSPPDLIKKKLFSSVDGVDANSLAEIYFCKKKTNTEN